MRQRRGTSIVPAYTCSSDTRALHTRRRFDVTSVTHFCVGTSPATSAHGMAIGAADPTTLTEHPADVAGHVVAHVGIVG